jgi:hypothetical protein
LKKPHPIDPDEPFPSDYVNVERIVAKEVRISEKNEPETYYLVKWQGLQYAEATWEHEKDVNVCL